MVFSSVTFIFYFLPIFLAAYFLLPFKNTVLLIASLVFYAWGEIGYTLLLILSILFNFLFGILINKYKNTRYVLTILGFGVGLNLILLSYFKYFNFLSSEILGIDVGSSVHLPLGISFFTFQAISYLVDVYRKEAKVECNPFDLGLYIAMFPQLIAGPIVRYKSVAIAIKQRTHDFDQAYRGAQIFILGLAQKVLIANQVALPADYIFALSAQELTPGLAWLGALCYGIQIFFDFAGYSNMAIGLGVMLGFRFPQNFNYPYIADSVTDFWRRWHISLSTWFRDYLYIPLGGNRKSNLQTYLNLLLVFLLCGLWHGAAWVFIIWGMYHGSFLILERLFLSYWLQNIWKPFRHLYTLLVVLVGWVIFRVEDIAHLNQYLSAMFYVTDVAAESYQLPALFYLSKTATAALIVGILLSMPIYPAFKSRLNHWRSQAATVRYQTWLLTHELFCLLILVFSLAEVASGGYNPFIYFRF